VAGLQTRVSSSSDADSSRDRHSTTMRSGGNSRHAKNVGRGSRPRPLEWHLGDRVRVRADRIDPMRKRVEFALVEQS